ncbi:nucleoside diphosphate-linked moiety X motif 8 [Melanotaenia boesemani]|uniref:nucleoside diphosphate-linked moiety X motif 8 n=1 Tax=Melanotaenia boesemani TaxID=1250792 RepID=UPI001C04470E|nr:nucleoside diphosphate-linked moiety X motif 8 [Melanotaenia boesemani]
MFRGLQIPFWACPIRPSLLLRESHLSAFSEHIGSGWQGARHEKIYGRGLSKDGSSLSTRTSENLLAKAILSHHLHPQVSATTKQLSYLVNTFWDCLINSTFLQRLRSPLDLSHPSLSWINKNQCNPLQSHLHHRQHPVSSSSLSTHKLWILNKFNCKSLPFSHFFHQTRAAHQAAPSLADTWRDSLSPENENRCRQTLGSNCKLYEMDKVRKGASQTRGRNQGKWASILVCLCSVEGEPAFLFTLRSSTLKGRHKGDVSFAGGKSDPSDKDVVATALREAWEELGVNVEAERVWGIMKPLVDMSGMMIAPVLANLGPLEELTFKPNPEEVEEIFTLSVAHLCNPLNRGYTHFRIGDKYGYTMPVFRNGKHRVWGLTAVALDQTLKLVVPPE